ncbi:amyloid protein-binding protein 2 [Trichonephila clavipes]|nr:amyloid protein-binding protein 2 [Trichonephila clavipes]
MRFEEAPQARVMCVCAKMEAPQARVIDHIMKTLSIKESLLPKDHFLLPSAKRVHALIVEEIAIDSHDSGFQNKLFFEAEDLHKSALHITQQCLGEKNVQTGKHYGNLGRLYQSMRHFSEARRMHLKAIAIKQDILGPNDYEVGISMGHLASLYNYDLGLYEEAITLYKKTIKIVKLLDMGVQLVDQQLSTCTDCEMEFKAHFEKLMGAANWRKWKQQIELLLQHHNVHHVCGDWRFPSLPAEALAEVIVVHEKVQKAFIKDDSLAQLIPLMGNMDDNNAELTVMCNTVKECGKSCCLCMCRVPGKGSIV